MNNKGFTLVELLAMLVVLGILIGIAVPNMTGILSQQKESAIIDDATKLLNTAKMTISTKRKIKRPKDGNCIVFSMDYLDKAAELKVSADGAKYVRDENFVLVKRSGSKIEYSIRLVEETTPGSEELYGIEHVDLETIESEKTSVLTPAFVEGYGMETATPDTLISLDPFTSCNTIEAVYK